MRNIHVVSHTHWDREWYLPFQSFRLKLIHLIDGLLDLLEKDPHFKYFLLDGQTIILDDYLAMRPGKEAILRQYVQKGRILIGPWHILPDMFLVGPESHIRNLLQGETTVRKFGPKMMVGYIPDPFGHPGQVPQILRGFGIETACLWRGLDEEPAEFWWQSPDGSRVLMIYLRDSYSNGASLPAEQPAAFAENLSLEVDTLADHSVVSDYLVMYGTDHMEPPPETSKAIAYADKVLKETHVVHSTLPKFVAALWEDINKQKLNLPTVSGELRACKRMHLLPGVLSTRMWIKQRNQASENLLTSWVEPFSTIAKLVATYNGPRITKPLSTGVHAQLSTIDDPSSIVRYAWRLLMENHPHDSICGCSIDQVHDEMKVRFDQVDQIGEELARQSLETITSAISTQTSTENQRSAIVIFNPTSSTRTDLVNLTLELPAGMDEFDLVDENGTIFPYQARGLGSQELINMQLDAKGLQSAFGSISNGRAVGMTIQDIKVMREGSQVFIDAILTEGGEPDLAAWQAGRGQIDEYLADPAVTDYHVRARSASTAQVVLAAQDVPGLGYRTLWLRAHSSEAKTSIHVTGSLVKALLPLARMPIIKKLIARKHSSKPPYKIANDFFVVEAMQDGTLSLLDKRDGRHFKGLNQFVDGADCGDEYNYSPPAIDRFTSPHLKRVTVELGPVQQSIELELELKTPAMLAPDSKSRSKEETLIPITTTISLMNAVPRLDIHTTVDNSAKDHRLRVHFPAFFAAGTGSHDGHFEVVERKVGLPAFDGSWIERPRPEVPQRAFTDVSDGSSGLMLAVRGLPEVEVLKNSQMNAEIALTLLRCVGWLSRDDFSARHGHAGPFMETPAAQVPGKWAFDYSLIPHKGDWRSAFWQAYAFQTPLRAVTTSLHTGNLPPSGAFVETTPGTFVVSAVKQAEDGGGWLVRGYNITGEPITVTLKPWKPSRQVELVNLAEEKQSALKPDEIGRVTFPVRSHEIVSVLFRA